LRNGTPTRNLHSEVTISSEFQHPERRSTLVVLPERTDF
jgi:hypothetical protein